MENKNINAMRLLSLHAIKLAKQGHVGMSMSAAPLTYTLYTEHINIFKDDPKWINRDRFVLSAGHGSMSIYSVLHFAGLLSLDDIKAFKTKDSKTPGHPEYEHDNFIDASTGPLGQGAAMAVGMAIAEKYLNAKFAKLPGLLDHHTYAVVGDGDIQEGIVYEAMSLAGKLQLNKLIFLHDSNDYQLDSKVDLVFTEDLKKRMESMQWNYLKTSNDVAEISKAIEAAKKSNKPTYIEVKTIIGEGVHTQASNKAHSMALTDQDIVDANTHFHTAYKALKFEPEIYSYFEKHVVDRGAKKYAEWIKLAETYAQIEPALFQTFTKWAHNDFGDLQGLLSELKFPATGVATRNYVKDVLSFLNQHKSDWLMAGSADLVAATNVKIGDNCFNSDVHSNHIFYGIREFAMAAITNGILLHGGLKTISGTFLVFSDYMKSAIRLGALMQLPNIYIFTHDTYQVGGDGPTHQPVDQLAMLRAIPNVIVHKPCDEKEFISAFSEALTATKQSHVIILTRQNLSSDHNTSIKLAKLGGYIVSGVANADVTLAGAGSEVDLLFATQKLLATLNINAKVVSIPCLQNFLKLDETLISKTLESKNGILTVEASSDASWYKLFKHGRRFYHVEANAFGKSMDGAQLYKDMGFDPQLLVSIIKKHIL